MAWSHYTQDGRLKDRGGLVPLQGVVFSAYEVTASGATTGWRKVGLDAKDFDPYAWFDTTNSRFLPKQAGYYRISGTAYPAGNSGETAIAIYKNGSIWKILGDATSTTAPPILSGSELVYLNGTTDYVELYFYSASSMQLSAAAGHVHFSGNLVGATGFINNWLSSGNDVFQRAGHVGIGSAAGLAAIPAWNLSRRALAFACGGPYGDDFAGFNGQAHNCYFDGTNWRYATTAAASLMEQDPSGNINFYSAASGTAGTVITFVFQGSFGTNGFMPPGNVQYVNATNANRVSSEFTASSGTVGAGGESGTITVTHSLGVTPSIAFGQLEDGSWSHEFGWRVSSKSTTQISFIFRNNGPNSGSAVLRFHLLY